MYYVSQKFQCKDTYEVINTEGLVVVAEIVKWSDSIQVSPVSDPKIDRVVSAFCDELTEAPEVIEFVSAWSPEIKEEARAAYMKHHPNGRKF